MPITNFLDLADVYRFADQSRAAKQQATLRDLQIADATRAQQQNAALEDIARQSNGDPELMSQEAMRRGIYKQGMEFQDKALSRKKQKFDLTKQQAEVMGQLADDTLVYDDPTYQRVLQNLEDMGEKSAADQLRGVAPSWDEKVAPMLRQIGMQGMTAYQRGTLENNRLKALAKANKENEFKPSDFNAMKRHVADLIGAKVYTDSNGTLQIAALNPEQSKMVEAVMHLAERYYRGGLRSYTHSVRRAMQDLKGTYHNLPVEAVAPSAPRFSQQDAIRAWQNPKNRPEVLRRLKAANIDPSFLPNYENYEERVQLPKPTLGGSSGGYSDQEEDF